MPNGYPYNFYDMKSSCQLVGFDDTATCLIGSGTRMDIQLNGNKLN